MKLPDFVFTCRKCQHEVYISKAKVLKILKTDCSECGEEPNGNWIFTAEGNYELR